MSGKQCDRPVSLIDLYPTLLELSGVPKRTNLDGKSIVPLLKNPAREWTRPVLTTFGRGNHAVRTERWRFIEYHDGGQELYDHNRDANEWNNLATNPLHAPVIQRLQKVIQTRTKR